MDFGLARSMEKMEYALDRADWEWREAAGSELQGGE